MNQLNHEYVNIWNDNTSFIFSSAGLRNAPIKLYSVTNGDQVGIDVINRQHSTYLLSMLCITQYVMRF
jgi:hypothetical protein